MTDQAQEPRATSSGPPEPVADGAAPKVRDETAELRAQVAQLDERYRRAVADFDNLRKRTARDAHREREDERARVAARWLPVVDNLELALHHATAEPASILSGLEAVRQQALAVLADLGYPLRNDLNERFDPSRHEAVAVLPATDAEPGTILQVVRPGYGTDARPLRPAAVVVAKGA
ncbi:nucleotide exchange factor GrpE [Cryptosporangium arvum]|uniref:Protein GrpE n=1 Tax=Cryptosporangium arvum DSM 44712 TaxID=927661 RepID=A0A011AJH5_9ACTN|nr:nucleotide exchange factor GrpE [Cryptosporangium arvum]EXG82166.1 molecular chaperone GrpE (heat shock protein) [Cryptosporangium arvum DSM 44712]